MNDVYEANVRIKDLPKEVDRILNMIASTRSMLKWEVVRDAMIEYAERHKDEIKVPQT